MGKVNKKSSMVGAIAIGALAGVFLVGRASADGIPATGALTYSGTLEDVNGVALTGSKQIGVALYDAQAAGTQQCSVTQTVALVNGRFQVLLPDACTQAAQQKPDLWVEVTADGSSLGRTKLAAVPYAAEASHAVSATNAANAANAANATGALAAQIAALTQRVTVLEGKPAPVSRVDRYNAVPGDSYFTECLNQSGTFAQGACDRMADYTCKAKGYASGWFQGDIGAASSAIAIVCIK